MPGKRAKQKEGKRASGPAPLITPELRLGLMGAMAVLLIAFVLGAVSLVRGAPHAAPAGAAKASRAEQLRFLKLASTSAYEETHAMAQKLKPGIRSNPPATWAAKWDKVQSKLADYKLRNVTDADVFFVPNFIGKEEAVAMQELIDTVYRNWKLQEPLCFDRVWDHEPKELKPDWYWKDMIVDAKIVKPSDLETRAEGGMRATCLKREATTPNSVRALRDFLNVSRSVMVKRGTSSITDDIEKRLEDVAGLPPSKGYFTQYLHYTKGENYNVHTDCFHNAFMDFQGRDDRFITILLYLSSPEGGETDFPLLKQSFQPKLGDLVIWRNLDDAGLCNTFTFHTALPVRRGHKYVFQRWYNIEDTDHTSPEFTDVANSMGCDRNGACREYMYAHQVKKGVSLP